MFALVVYCITLLVQLESGLIFQAPKDPSDCSLEERLWRKVSVVRLAERQGFGFAVKALCGPK